MRISSTGANAGPAIFDTTPGGPNDPALNVAFAPVRSSLPPSAVARPFKRNAESPDGIWTTRELVAATWWLTVKAPGFTPRIVNATATVESPPPVVTVDLARPSARVVRGMVVVGIVMLITVAMAVAPYGTGSPDAGEAAYQTVRRALVAADPGRWDLQYGESVGLRGAGASGAGEGAVHVQGPA